MTADRKPTLGEFLKNEREKRGFTIEQTSSATKIGLKILKRLEADRYVDLPALPFVRGFVRNYGKFLGLDGEKLLADYAEFLTEHSNERPKRDAGHSGYAFERPEGEQSRKILWGVMSGMLIFGGAVVFLFKPSLKRKHHGHVDKMMVETPSPGESPPPSSPPSGVPEGIPSATPASTPTAPSASPSSASPHASLVVPFHPPKIPLVLAPSPLPVATPVPSLVPSPVPAVVPAPVVPAPIPSPVVTAIPESSVEADLKADPLQSGRNLLPREVHQKIVLRTKANVWVRYRCDGKKLMKFALKADKILVLRAKTAVYLQVSNPDSITIQPSGQGEALFSEFSGAFEYGGNQTAAFPSEIHEKIEENFKVGAALPALAAPSATE